MSHFSRLPRPKNDTNSRVPSRTNEQRSPTGRSTTGSAFTQKTTFPRALNAIGGLILMTCESDYQVRFLPTLMFNSIETECPRTPNFVAIRNLFATIRNHSSPHNRLHCLDAGEKNRAQNPSMVARRISCTDNASLQVGPQDSHSLNRAHFKKINKEREPGWIPFSVARFVIDAARAHFTGSS